MGVLGCGLNEHLRGSVRYGGLDCRPRQYGLSVKGIAMEA